MRCEKARRKKTKVKYLNNPILICTQVRSIDLKYFSGTLNLLLTLLKMFAKKILQYYREIGPPKNLPKEVETMNPYQNEASFAAASKFYKKYYSDNHPRFICFGINPGRFGAGVTGVPFTDPLKLEEECGIKNNFEKKAELSSRFVYEMIDEYGGPEKFYSKFFISGVSPLGFLKDGINLNYYDIKGYKKLFEKYVAKEIEKQLAFNIERSVAYSIGKGQNIQFLNWINDKYQFFKEILPLPHPRWVMQYRLKRKAEFIQEYMDQLAKASS